jgi:uncharacterized protein
MFLFLVRRLILITLIALPQSFWMRRGWRLAGRVRDMRWRSALRALVPISLVAIIAVLADRISFRFIPHSISERITPPIQLWIFTSTFAFFCIKGVHAVEWFWLTIKKLGRRTLPEGRVRYYIADPSRRTFFRYAAAFVGTMPFLAAFYGYARERLNFQIVRVDVPIANLPPALDGFRIVQLSDIHAGDFMPQDEIRRAVDMANDTHPHLAIVTGDFISGPGDPLAACIAELSRLKAPLGVWGCNGNHEIYAHAEDAAEALFQRHGMKLLRHTNTQLTWNGSQLNLIGVDYQRDIHLTGSRMPTLDGVEALVRRDMPNILLSHNPNTFYRAAELGIELSIAGHTHGGQITVEIVNQNISPARFMTKFIAGLYRLPMPNSAQSCLYVNRGLGTLGIPARLGSLPEITVMTLRSA